ncbi:hypothetical protein GIB67_000856 [Kingdonia uniflora]|uniref:Uncharacterized protein n=1 Tax=Kingdonia uniflora TaxID=39325 RepID=A0A7J7LFQ8_9MAGN|nr:hypothetical protein GIB67_000856 [Kingdonia uniflora]
MSSGNGNGKSSYVINGSLSAKGKNVSHGSPRYPPGVNQLSHDKAATNIESSQDGAWEVYGKKNRNKAGNNVQKQWAPQGSAPRAWGEPNVGAGSNGDWKKPVGRGNTKTYLPNTVFEKAYVGPPPVIPPPLQNGWSWPARTDGSSQPVLPAHIEDDDGHIEEDDDDDDEIMDDTDDDLLSDDYDSDASTKSHDTRKKSKWFNTFFEQLENLSPDEINEPSRQWHCPACQNGRGSINWYTGLQPLMVHAKTRRAKRVKPHREFAELLDEELIRLGTSVIPSGEAFGKWKGLRETVSDREIVWPPMVVVMNTQLERADNEKWIGMGNPELLEYFSSYKAVKARHSYGPQGHRGMSVLIFEPSAMGFLEAERLHKHFIGEKTDRDAWDHRRVLFYPGGERQLYGYLADNNDLNNFNQHSQGKTKLKFEMRSYLEMVDGPMKKMSKDNEQLVYLKNKVDRERKHSKALQESFGVVSEKLRKTMQENRIVRQRTKAQHEQNKEEMDFQEKFYKDQIGVIQEALAEKEKHMEELLQKERNKLKQSEGESKSKEEQELRKRQTDKFIHDQDEGIEEFEAKRES